MYYELVRFNVTDNHTIEQFSIPSFDWDVVGSARICERKARDVDRIGKRLAGTEEADTEAYWLDVGQINDVFVTRRNGFTEASGIAIKLSSDSFIIFHDIHLVRTCDNLVLGIETPCTRE